MGSQWALAAPALWDGTADPREDKTQSSRRQWMSLARLVTHSEKKKGFPNRKPQCLPTILTPLVSKLMKKKATLRLKYLAVTETSGCQLNELEVHGTALWLCTNVSFSWQNLLLYRVFSSNFYLWHKQDSCRSVLICLCDK